MNWNQKYDQNEFTALGPDKLPDTAKVSTVTNFPIARKAGFTGLYGHIRAHLNYFDNYEELEQTVLICFMRNSMGKYYDMLFKNLLLCFNVLTILNYLLIVIYLQKSLILKYLPCGIHVTNLRMINTDDDNARLTKVLFFYTGVYFTTNMAFSTSLKLLSVELS
uniref:Uncharacterized protein n=1 Tax=Romanomermis culicivorax TaxID=13658 RepID=A0A915JRS6_ROMCU